ncbi:efflux transporter, outer membrane factor (OMF) lipoprotein, NodT family [Dyella jiangningensis]|uniref:efflux transporter outer membrane subunit n=1 Tax=Dyella sp. AtDHG13 TaxID=1938897 RepID=UPI00087EE86A|nr:efflux transporter outer membrane subunit [Dyella sp. AtDHG13]PXV53308.1 NodT family efflux transporter outer membrane factor (OMF) lipoprotein [Dyella sp. AtDHG13]SDL34634.1 efflux transporter, outer membrane factor (OMF) lipoprotein, NodT family [Dyella jiangningensis]
MNTSLSFRAGASRVASRRSSLRMAAMAAALLGLAGCTVGPDYVRPEVKTHAQYSSQSMLDTREAAQSAPELDTWWQGFGDPELTRIIGRVMAQNLDLAAAMARVDQARAAAREAGAQLAPQGSLDGQLTQLHQSTKSPLGEIASHTPGYQRTQTLENIGVGASWELDLAGGLHRGAEAADAEAQAAEANRDGVRVSIAAEAADSYFQVRGAQERIRLAQQQIDTETQLLELVKVRLAGGLATSREAAQAQALVLQAKATLPPLRTTLAQQLNRLDVLMGVPPGTYAAELKDSPRNYTVPAIATDGGPDMLLRRRPDVIAAERKLAASNARIGVAVAEYYPKVSLGGLLGFDSLHSGSLFSSQAFQPQAVLGLHWRLFDFGRVDAEVAQAKGANAEALALYRQSMLRATEDVENAIVSLAELETQHRDLTDEVKAHEDARAAAQDAYKGGAVSLIEVLDEDRQLLASRDELARVHADDARAAVATFRALGGGWSNGDAGEKAVAER